MPKKNEAWGVEVGAQAIKVLKLVRTGGGVALEDFEVLPFKHVLTTPDLNVEEAIRVNLESLAQKYEFDKSNVVVSVPGHLAFARFAKLPPIEASKVKSIVAYEAQQQIPFPIDEVEWDYQVFAQEDAPDIEVGIFAITKERVAHFLSNYRAVDLRVDTLTLSPVAVYNAFAYDSDTGDGPAGNTVYLDIGTVSTDIIVVESGGIWLRTLPLGGNHFTNALMKQFKISFAKAEKLKLEAGTSKYAKQIFQAMRGVFSDLVSEIQRSLGFYQSLNRDAELTRIVGVGSTWKLPGLQKYLTQNLQMDVMRPDGFGRIEVDGRRAAEFSSVAVNMATAYGLALQGLGLGSVDANILPQTILRQRMWNAKQPWFGAAAACVAGAGILFPIMQFMAGSGFDAAWSPTVQNDIKETIREGQKYKSLYDTEVIANDPRPGIRNFRRSFDYANLYPKLLDDVTQAMSTIKPNPEFADLSPDDPADVAKIAAIPRNERKQAWITEVKTQYVMPESSQEGAVQNFDEFGGGEFGGTGAFPGEFDGGAGFTGGGEEGLISGSDATRLTPKPFPASAPVYADTSSDDGSSDTADTGASIKEQLKTKPHIIVTVQGETTMTGPEIAAELNDKFVGWMKHNATRGDRPYVLVAELIETRFIRRGTVTGSTGSTGSGLGSGDNLNGGLRKTPTPKSSTGAGQPGFGDDGLGGPGLTPPGAGGLDGLGGTGLDGGLEQPGVVEVQTPEGWYASLGSGGIGFSADVLLPRRPLSIEDKSDDSLFTFKFKVLLLSPDEARKTILPQPEESDEDSDDATDTTASNLPTNATQPAGQEDQS